MAYTNDFMRQDSLDAIVLKNSVYAAQKRQIDELSKGDF
jgi:hypothetical protein